MYYRGTNPIIAKTRGAYKGKLSRGTIKHTRKKYTRRHKENFYRRKASRKTT